MTDNLFDNVNNDDVVLDKDQNYFDTMVGPEKKFKDQEALARGKAESDSYIQILTRRLDEREADNKKLRDEYNAAASLREIIDQMKNQRREPNLEAPEMREVNIPPAIDKSEIESMVTSRVQQLEVERKQQDNWNSVKSKLEEVYGQNFGQILNKQTRELGLTVDDVNALARKSPAAFFRTLGLEDRKQDSFQTPPRSDMRNDNFAPQGAKKRTWAYYQNLKRSDPRLYNNPKTAIQMHKDFEQLGDEFKDGDWSAV